MRTRSSSKMEKVMRMVNEDRLSSLPDELIHNIFSSLDMKVVVGTSILSRRWRDLWKFVPAINIYSNKQYGVKFNRMKYDDFVGRLLLKGTSNIKRLCWNGSSSFKSKPVKMWIYSAIRRNVQELCLENSALNWKTLNYIGGNIKTLQLVEVAVLGYSVTGQIDICFKSVEDLTMKNCYCDDSVHQDFSTSGSRGYVNINAPRLSNLVLNDEAYRLSMIRVTAPNLKKLDFKIKSWEDYTFFDVRSLVTTHIDTIIASWGNRASDCEVLHNYLNKVFRKVENARSLTLSACSFKILSEGPSILTPTSISFRDIRYLELKDWCGCNHSRVIPRMIKAFPDIDTLVSERHKISFTTSRGGWESELSAKFMQCDFKTVEFQTDGGWGNDEFKFLEFLLREATMLKDVTLTICQKDKDYDKGRTLVMLPTPTSSESILVQPTKSFYPNVAS